MTGWTWDERLAEDLLARFAAWAAGNCSGDITAVAEHLHPDFLYVSVFGRRYDRRGYLDLVAGLAPGARYVFHGASARALDGIAQLDGTYWTHSVTTTGEDLSAHTRFTATWVREADRWLCLTQQGSPYEPEPAPSTPAGTGTH